MLSVLFVGSVHESDPKSNEFHKLCFDLGAAVAAEHCILVCGTTPRTADHSVALGAFATIEKDKKLQDATARIKLYHTPGDESQKSDNDMFTRFRDGEQKCTRIETNVPAEESFREAIKACDVIVIIGGGDTTNGIVDKGINAQKPILGFRAYGGVGKDANFELDRVYRLMKVPSELTSVLQAPDIDRHAAKTFCALLAKVHERNPWSATSSWVKRSLLFLALVILCVYWFWACQQAYVDRDFMTYDSVNWLFPACLTAGISGAFSSFLLDLGATTRGMVKQLLDLITRGITPAVSIAGFARAVLEMVFHRTPACHDFNFGTLVLVCSLLTAGASFTNRMNLEKIIEYVHNIPRLQG